jgi:hypothetical protein
VAGAHGAGPFLSLEEVQAPGSREETPDDLIYDS